MEGQLFLLEGCMCSTAVVHIANFIQREKRKDTKLAYKEQNS